MRFNQIEIPAFGPFENFTLVLPRDGHDFHVIYGLNEAGKSSLLRAIGDLLYGIPGQSWDNFLHDYNKLRIGADIEGRDGRCLRFQRRKGNKNTLLDGEGNAIEDGSLAIFLGGVDRTYFSAMFGLGSRDLREGAAGLLRGEGDLGQALFSAGRGGVPVERVLAELMAEAEKMFKGRTKAGVTIRPTADAYGDLVKKARETAIKPEDWEGIERELGDADKRKSEIENGLRDLRSKLDWLTRCADALPAVGKLAEKMKQLAALPQPPEVPGDFVERSRRAAEAVAACRQEVDDLEKDIGHIEDRLATTVPDEAVLERGAEIEAIHLDLGAYANNDEALAASDSRRVTLETGLRSGMASLGLGGDFGALESLRLTSPVRLACQQEAVALAQAIYGRDQNAAQLNEVRMELGRQRERLAGLGDVDVEALRAALDEARLVTGAEKEIPETESRVVRLSQEVGALHRSLQVAPPDHRATRELAVPSKTTIAQHRAKMDEARHDRRNWEKRRDDIAARRDGLMAEIKALRRIGDLPSLDDLSEARTFRDLGWRLVVAEWKGGGAPQEFVAGCPLEEAYPKAVAHADTVSDRLRNEAATVAQMAEKTALLEGAEQELADAQGKIANCDSAWAERLQHWEDAWGASGLTPASPDEMEEWRDTWVKFCQRFDELDGAKAELEAKRRRVAEASALLSGVMGVPVGPSLAALFGQATERVRAADERRGERHQLSNGIADLERAERDALGRVQPLDAAVVEASARWRDRARSIDLDPEADPQIGLQVLEERKDLLKVFDDWNASVAQAKAARHKLHEFEGRVGRLGGPLGASGSAREVTIALWQRLSEAREKKAAHDGLAEQLRGRRADMGAASAALSRAEHELSEVLRLAGVSDADSLAGHLAIIEEHAEIRKGIDALRETLAGLARGADVDAFVAQVQAELAAGEIGPRQMQLDADIRANEGELETVRGAIAAAKNRLAELEMAGVAAADLQQQASLKASALRDQGSRYIRLRLAARFLEDQIERFRRENQGPLLQRSGEIFQRITCGGFDGLATDYDDEDHPVLVGMKGDRRVPVEGMSDGTRDQLFLALRLAALERHIAAHEPMPLILDDLLATFDDLRAEAILRALGEISQRSQVLLFTHHSHVLQILESALPGAHRVHRIGAR